MLTHLVSISTTPPFSSPAFRFPPALNPPSSAPSESPRMRELKSGSVDFPRETGLGKERGVGGGGEVTRDLEFGGGGAEDTGGDEIVAEETKLAC
eukprot:1357607-Amorphochlora_amoeboformis.AAC.1